MSTYSHLLQAREGQPSRHGFAAFLLGEGAALAQQVRRACFRKASVGKAMKNHESKDIHCGLLHTPAKSGCLLAFQVRTPKVTKVRLCQGNHHSQVTTSVGGPKPIRSRKQDARPKQFGLPLPAICRRRRYSSV